MKEFAMAIVCFVLMASVQSGCAEPPTGSQPETKSSSVLVDPGWLEKHVNDPAVRIIDVAQTEEQYAKGHLPGAVFVHWVKDITDPADAERYNVAGQQMMQTLLSRLGVGKTTTIVLYDDLDNRLATRMFWTLRFYGHSDVRILDGGRKSWARAGKNFVSDVAAFETTTYRIDKVNDAYRASMEFINAHLDDPQAAFIDGRPSEQYTGEKPGKVFHTGKEQARKGHIPGALNIVWKDNFNEDGTFKSAAELRKLYESRGVTSEKTIVTYCNEGLHAAPPWFVLTELLGYSRVKLYDDSMAEWANTPDVPIVTGTKP